MRSRTKQDASPKEVFAALLSQLIEKNVYGSWVTFYYIETSWVKRKFILGSGPPCATVKLMDASHFQLDFGLPLKIDLQLTFKIIDLAEYCRSNNAEIPQSWSMIRDGRCLIHLTDMQSLVDWLDKYFLNMKRCPPNYRVSGHLEGLTWFSRWWARHGSAF